MVPFPVCHSKAGELVSTWHQAWLWLWDWEQRSHLKMLKRTLCIAKLWKYIQENISYFQNINELISRLATHMPEPSLIKFNAMNVCTRHHTNLWLNTGLCVLILWMCRLFLKGTPLKTLRVCRTCPHSEFSLGLFLDAAEFHYRQDK